MLLVQGCSETPPAPAEAAQRTPKVTIQSEIADQEQVQSFEINNCDGKADIKRTEQRSQSIEASISKQLAATVGATVNVITAEIQAVVGSAIGQERRQGTAIELVAPPQTWMRYELVWIGTGKTGVVYNLRDLDIPVTFHSFTPLDVRIKSQYDIGCSSGSPRLIDREIHQPLLLVRQHRTASCNICCS